MPLQGVSTRYVRVPEVETPGSITPLLRSEERSLMRMPLTPPGRGEGWVKTSDFKRYFK